MLCRRVYSVLRSPCKRTCMERSGMLEKGAYVVHGSTSRARRRWWLRCDLRLIGQIVALLWGQVRSVSKRVAAVGISWRNSATARARIFLNTGICVVLRAHIDFFLVRNMVGFGFSIGLGSFPIRAGNVLFISSRGCLLNFTYCCRHTRMRGSRLNNRTPRRVWVHCWHAAGRLGKDLKRRSSNRNNQKP